MRLFLSKVVLPFFSMNILKNYTLEKHLRIVLSLFFPNSDLHQKKQFNFRCNICKDSKKNKFKKRGYLILRHNDKVGHDTWQFYCHNCGASMYAEKWLKQYFPQNYKDYIKEILCQEKYDSTSVEETLKKQQEKTELKLRKKEIEDVKYFQKIENFGDAEQFCKDRLIPENIWKMWFVGVGGKYKDRIIIPFYDDKGNIYWWQGRTLTNQIPKYLNRVANRNNAIYNYYNIDKKRPVIVTEGPIDSVFLENSIAVLGTKIPEKVKEKLDKLNCYYLFDNDEEGRKISLKYLLNNKYVFIWQKFIKDIKVDVKDINELVIKQNFTDIIKFKDIEKYFTNNIFDKIYF